MQSSWEPYFRLLRLHQPVGIFLLLWPCWWSLALASGSNPSVWLLILFALGAAVMRGAGCILNDVVDRDFDRHVERTRSRPIASGEIGVKQALRLMVALLCIALLIALMMNKMVLAYAAFSLVLVAAYPFMKRITWWPQAFLGLTFNWGALLGWIAVRGHVEIPAAFLYIGGIFWTLGYDTVYAHQDKADDMMIGVKSTALRLGGNSRKWIAMFYYIAVTCWLISGIVSGATLYYYVGLLLVSGHFIWQLRSLDINAPDSCIKIFRSNAVLGFIMFVGCYV